MGLSRRFFAAGLAALGTMPGTVLAHREAASHTFIKWNGTTKFLDVTHRFHMHDAAQALVNAGKLRKPDLTTLRARARLALYTEDNFTVQNQRGTPLTFDLLGADFEGSSIYVYQQIKLTAPPQGLQITCLLFHGLIENQVNDVDVDFDGIIKSARFKMGDPFKIILA